MTEIKKGIYKHFKTKEFYRVLGVGKHTETKEILVLYYSKENPEKLWARPLEMFKEKIQTETGVVPRFEFISD